MRCRWLEFDERTLRPVDSFVTKHACLCLMISCFCGKARDSRTDTKAFATYFVFVPASQLMTTLMGEGCF